MQDSFDQYDETRPIIESEPELDLIPDPVKKNTIVSTETNDEYYSMTKKLIGIDEKQWNIHMLRVCAKCLTELPKKDFKKKRYIATISNNFKLEKKILEQMLCDKARTLSPDEFPTYYKRLYEFDSKHHLHPRKKYIDY